MAPDIEHVFLWLDFGCINQDGNPAGELKQLDKIVEMSDAIFTPIVDYEAEEWRLHGNPQELLVNYKAKLWFDGEHAYLNRG